MRTRHRYKTHDAFDTGAIVPATVNSTILLETPTQPETIGVGQES